MTLDILDMLAIVLLLVFILGFMAASSVFLIMDRFNKKAFDIHLFTPKEDDTT